MNLLVLLALGIAAWFAVSVPLGIVTGKWLKRGSRQRENLDRAFTGESGDTKPQSILGGKSHGEGS